MKVEIRWATRRDLCYVAAIATEDDKAEILASGPRNMTECGYLTWEALDTFGGIAWCAWIDGNPEFAFGFTPQHLLMPHLLSAWAWGSPKKNLAMIEIARWAKGDKTLAKPSLIDRLDLLGAVRIEARSIASHAAAHRWLEWLGFRRECDLEQWGKDKQRFVQYSWLRSEFAGFGKHGNATFGVNDHVHGKPAGTAAPLTALD